VGILKARTGSYDAGFFLLGAVCVAGGLCLTAYGRLVGRAAPVAAPSATEAEARP
jgi:hypothetical protein